MEYLMLQADWEILYLLANMAFLEVAPTKTVFLKQASRLASTVPLAFQVGLEVA
jgi:hypothetical protein